MIKDNRSDLQIAAELANEYLANTGIPKDSAEGSAAYSAFITARLNSLVAFHSIVEKYNEVLQEKKNLERRLKLNEK